MAFFKEHPSSPIEMMQSHAGMYMNWVKLGAVKFKDKEQIAQMFQTMASVELMYEQSMSGTMYDIKKRVDPSLWEAVLREYDEDMPKLREAAEGTELTDEEKEEFQRITAAMEMEHKEMRKWADDWFAVHGRGGCAAALLLIVSLPAAAGLGLWYWF